MKVENEEKDKKENAADLLRCKAREEILQVEHTATQPWMPWILSSISRLSRHPNVRIGSVILDGAAAIIIRRGSTLDPRSSSARVG